MHILDAKQRNAVQKGLEWIRDHSTIEDDGSVETTIEIPYYAAKEIITRYTRIDESIPERTQRRAVNLAIRRWFKYKKYRENDDLASAFLEALEVEIRQLKRERRFFHVLMFLNLDRSDIQDLEPISILGDKIILKQWNDLSPLKTDDLWQRIRSSDPSNPIWLQLGQYKRLPNTFDLLPVLLDVETYGPEAAVTVANDRLDVLRAILNMSALLGSFIYFRSEPKHLSAILPTPIYAIFDFSGNLVDTYYTIERYDYKKTRIQDTQLSNIKYLLPIFDHDLTYPDTEHHVLGLMRLYQAALDIGSPRLAYLPMWQVLESAVTFRGERLDTKKIRSRVSNLFKIDPLFEDALKVLADLRNELAHSGEFLERGDDAFFTLKLFADECIRRLLALAKDFPTVHELRDYITYATLGDGVLARKKKVISSIQQHRAN